MAALMGGETRQLQGDTRGDKYEVKPTDINELIRRHCILSVNNEEIALGLGKRTLEK